MKLAIIIQCHRITASLRYSIEKFKDRSDVFVVIHVDRKTALYDFKKLECSNVSLLPTRVPVNWGSFEQVRATLNSFHFLYNSGFDFEYVSLISGDDVLLKPIDEFMEFLDNNKGREFIGLEKKGDRFYDPSERILYRYPKVLYSKNLDIKRRFILLAFKFFRSFGIFRNEKFDGLPMLYKGSSWFTITSEAMNYIITYLNNNGEYEAAFINAFCADEVFFHSILMNSPYRNNINFVASANINDNEASLRYIDWESGPDFPRILSAEDLVYAKRTSLFFARKVSSELSLSDLQKILA